MKKLNKHPRLYKKMANTLKKLITNRIKLSRPKILQGQQNKGPNNSLKNPGNNNYFQQPQIIANNKLHKNINNNANDFSRIINVASFRKIPYNDFILRLTPYDYETYLKMIKMNYSCRLEIHLTNIRPMKFILEVLLDKWKNIPKIEPKINLYLIPIRELWIPKELIFFSVNDCDRIYDIGDIYTAYGSPSTNILHMKYQWNEDKLNLISNLNNLNQYNTNNNSLTNNLLPQQNESMIFSESHNFNNITENRLKLEASNLLNASHRTFINNNTTINNQINFNSNRAIKGEESQDMLNLSDLDINNSLNNEEDSDEKKNINITESINKNDAYNILDKLSEQDSMFPLDTELLDPMELLGFDADKKYDNLSNSASNKNKTPTKSKKNHLNIRHKKISFVNNIKPTESMINSSFANNKNNNNSNLKLRTGYSEVFSNNNSNVNNNINNLNNLAYTSNNNLSEVSSHINNSNHYINYKSEHGKQISNNKSPIINFGNNNSENKEIKNIKNILNNNSNIEEDSKIKRSNLTDPNNTESKQNIINDNNQNISIRKKKKLKFVNNVSKENILELKEKSSSIFDKPETKTNKNLSLNANYSFGQKPKQNNSKNEEINKTAEKNEKKEIINTNINNQSMNWNTGLGNGFTRLLGNNSNIGVFGFNDTNPFFGQNTLNANSFFDNTNFFRSNLNNSNLFNVDHTRHLNEGNQLSQMSYINKTEEKPINNSFIGNENTFVHNNININGENLINKGEDKDKDKEKDFLGKKRKNEDKSQKKEKKNNNKSNNKEKKSKKNVNINKDNNLKTPSFNNNEYNNLNQNRMNNFRFGFKGINNNYNMNNNINNYQNFPYNIDIPLPSKFFEESIGNNKK